MTRRAHLAEDHPCRDCGVSAEALCSALDIETLAELRHQGTNVKVEAGGHLFHQGDPADCVFSLTSGVIRLYSILPDGRRQIVAFLFPGDFVGLETRKSHGLSAEAISDAVLCRFLKSRFRWFVTHNPALADARYLRAENELALAQEQIVMLGRKTASERLACLLHDLYSRAGYCGENGAKLLPLPMSRADMADYLGITKETVSREFSRLRTSRIVRPHSHSLVEVLDLHRLRELAQREGQ